MSRSRRWCSGAASAKWFISVGIIPGHSSDRTSRPELAREDAREVVHAGLGGRIGRAPDDGRDRRERRGIDDAPGALALHDGDHRPAHQERALQVHVLVQVPGLLGQRLHRTAARHAGIVDEDVDAPEGLDDRGHDALDLRGIPHVAAMLLSAPAPPRELVGQRIQVFLPDVGDDGDDALAGERRGDLAADAPARPVTMATLPSRSIFMSGLRSRRSRRRARAVAPLPGRAPSDTRSSRAAAPRPGSGRRGCGTPSARRRDRRGTP